MARSAPKVVTAYVDLGLTKRPSGDFHTLGNRLIDVCWPNVHSFINFPFEKCWAVEELWYYPPANARAEDRFANEEEHRRSNLIQHSPMQWITAAALADDKPDWFVWIGYSVLKQGDFTNKRVNEEHVLKFLEKLDKEPLDRIPIPAINPKQSISPYGDNWQYVGSTVIMPRWAIPFVWSSYRVHLREFVRKYKAIPLDLAIWPAVVEKSGLPWRCYPADYDHTQFTNF